jgi:hypothetical protein
MKTSNSQVLLLGALCFHVANVYAVKTAGTQHALSAEHHVAALQATLEKKGSALSLSHLQGMEEALVALVLEKASPAVNAAVGQIMNIIETSMKPLVVERYNVKRTELLASYSSYSYCQTVLNTGLTSPDADLARLQTLKTQLETCVWGEYNTTYPESSNPNNPAVGRGASPSDGNKLSNVTYSALSCAWDSNPYLCGGWPNTYDPAYPYSIDATTSEPTTTMTTTICEATRSVCQGAKTACQAWENRHYIDNDADQINTLDDPSTTECDRRDFQSVGQYLLAMREYWNNSIFQSPNGWIPMKCQCDVELRQCQEAHLNCSEPDYTIDRYSSFYAPRWQDKMNTTYMQYCSDDYLPPLTATYTTTTTTTVTTTTTSPCVHCQTDCRSIQEEMDTIACNQTIQRVEQCGLYTTCVDSGDHWTNDSVYSEICGSPNGHRYGLVNEYYGILRIECVMNALYYNTSAEINASIMACRSVGASYYSSTLMSVNITECDNPSIPGNTSENCSELVNMSSYPNVSGTAAYESYYYEHLHNPAPCLSSCCTSLPSGVAA